MSEFSEAAAPDAGVSTSARRSIFRRFVSFGGRCAGVCARFCGLAWRGAALGLIAATLFFPVYGGLCLGTGLGTAVDVAGALLSPEEQRRVARVYISAFLEATLRGKSEYVPLFRDPRWDRANRPST